MRKIRTLPNVAVRRHPGTTLLGIFTLLAIILYLAALSILSGAGYDQTTEAELTPDHLTPLMIGNELQMAALGQPIRR